MKFGRFKVQLSDSAQGTRSPVARSAHTIVKANSVLILFGGHAETLIFDVLKLEWSVAVASPPSSMTTNKGFSLVLVQHKERDFLVAFCGFKKDPSNQVLIMEKVESSIIQT
ncbi:acyl- -binding domain-containing 4 [Olea europaea subsp. europaea]|uniref:Acyl- -binding domain-containing 4 n=1 Tax=Olea europaea subsp. europaea TaxID=158383 RepID=A0A8S0VBR4_OLEEU|nr:acyl- -binding domain-containing 4 [Olea europaea subsp. europaea]